MADIFWFFSRALSWFACCGNCKRVQTAKVVTGTLVQALIVDRGSQTTVVKNIFIRKCSHLMLNNIFKCNAIQFQGYDKILFLSLNVINI